MGLMTDIVATYRSPRAVMRRHLDRGSDESRALMYLVLSCGLLYFAQWPRLWREALADGSVTLDVRLGGALFGWLFVAPLVMYAVALVARLVARVFGGRGTGHSARLALFWSMAAATPLWLVSGLINGLLGPGFEATLFGIVGHMAFFLFWGLSMIEAEVYGARP